MNNRILILLAVLTFWGCRKDINNTTTNNDPYQLEYKAVTTSIIATVVDDNGIPLSGAVVSVGDEVKLSSEEGVVYFANITANEKGTMVKVEKDGFFITIKMLSPKEGTTSYSHIQLLKKKLIGTISSSEGGDLDISDGAKVSLSANSFKKIDGNAYDGQVMVYGTYLNAADSSYTLASRMPGDLRAVDLNREFKQLATFGMMAIELETPSGDILQLDEEKPATIHFPLDPLLASGTPSEIPLWYFNEDIGYWVEDGIASLENGVFSGEVTHFTFWNLDLDWDFVKVRGFLKTVDGFAVPDMTITLQLLSDPAQTAFAYTSGDGSFEGNVPKGEAMLLKVYDGCDNYLMYQLVGPFVDDENDLDDVVLPNNPNTDFVSLKGTVIGCNDLPVPYAYVLIAFDNGESTGITADATGSFNSVVNVCSYNEIYITGIDVVENHVSPTLDFDLNIHESLDINLRACDLALDEYLYIHYNSEDNIYLITDPIAHYDVEQNILDLGGQQAFVGTSDLVFVSMHIDELIEGEHPTIFSTFQIDQEGYFEICSDQAGAPCGTLKVNLQNMTNENEEVRVGDIIEGTFDGVLASGSHLWGNFRILVTN